VGGAAGDGIDHLGRVARDPRLGVRVPRRVPAPRSLGATRTTAVAYLAKVQATPPATWSALANWARETGHLMPWKRDLASRIGQMLTNGRKLSATQAIHGAQILDEAIRMGFAPE